MADPGIILRLRAVLTSAGGAGSDAQRERAAQARAAEDAQVGPGNREGPGGQAAESWRQGRGGWVSWGDGGAPPDEKQLQLARAAACKGCSLQGLATCKGCSLQGLQGLAACKGCQARVHPPPGLNRFVTIALLPLCVCGGAGSWSLLRSRCIATTWSRPIRASRLMATTGNEAEDGGQLQQPDGFDITEVCSLSRTMVLRHHCFLMSRGLLCPCGA